MPRHSTNVQSAARRKIVTFQPQILPSHSEPALLSPISHAIKLSLQFWLQSLIWSTTSLILWFSPLHEAAAIVAFFLFFKHNQAHLGHGGTSYLCLEFSGPAPMSSTFHSNMISDKPSLDTLLLYQPPHPHLYFASHLRDTVIFFLAYYFFNFFSFVFYIAITHVTEHNSVTYVTLCGSFFHLLLLYFAMHNVLLCIMCSHIFGANFQGK